MHVASFALALLSLVGWAFASAPGSSPDDDFHLASIWCGAGERAGICEPGPSAAERRIPAGVIATTCTAFRAESASCIVVDDPYELRATDRVNADGLYPPVYYFVTSAFAGPDIWGSVAAIRIFNAVVFLAFLGALLALAPRWARAPAVLVPIVSLVPLGAFLVASVNPSSWAITSALTVMGTLLLIPSSSGRRRIGLAVLAVLAAGLGAGARADSGLFSVLAVVVALVIGLRRGRDASWLLGTGAAVVLIGALGAFAGHQSAAAGTGLLGTPPTSADEFFQLLRLDLFQVPELWAGALGEWDLGWFDVPLDAMVWVVGWAVFAMAAFAGLRRVTVRKSLALVLMLLAMWGFPLLLQIQTRAAVGAYVQPRYVLPIMVMLLVVALLDERTSAHLADHGAAQRWSVVVGLVLSNALALNAVVLRYSAGTIDSTDPDDPGWWWTDAPLLGPGVVWLLGAAAFAGLLFLVIGVGGRRLAADHEARR
ncbi:MAG: DUF2142 domain-containing protein [Microbacteriaceae bacterium]|nr:DUF2142 domain-containing protein [Microbacteriaceae bacterium]